MLRPMPVASNGIGCNKRFMASYNINNPEPAIKADWNRALNASILPYPYLCFALAGRAEIFMAKNVMTDASMSEMLSMTEDNMDKDPV